MSYVLPHIQGFFKCSKFYINTYFPEEFLAYCDIDRAYEEMHILAYLYHWDRNSLWDIPISERRKWVSIVLEQQQREQDALERK